MQILSIVVFGVLGVLSRFYLGNWMTKSVSSIFPLGIFTINILGAFLIGVAYVAGVERMALSESVRVGLMVGFLGGFTTFSAYSLDIVKLIQAKEYIPAALYFSLSPVLAVMATFLGFAVTRYFFERWA